VHLAIVLLHFSRYSRAVFRRPAVSAPPLCLLPWSLIGNARRSEEFRVPALRVVCVAHVRRIRMSDWPELHVACWDNDVEKVERLIAAGASLNAALPDGHTPLDIAAASGHAHVVETLLRAQAGFKSVLSRSTPLYMAARNGHADVVRSSPSARRRFPPSRRRHGFAAAADGTGTPLRAAAARSSSSAALRHGNCFCRPLAPRCAVARTDAGGGDF
jgi:hypothetical protein